MKLFNRCFTDLNTLQVSEELGILPSDLVSNPKLKEVKWMETGAFGPNAFEVLFSFHGKTGREVLNHFDS